MGIGTELENPFASDDANALDMQDQITTLEKELMRMLECIGDAAAQNSFMWLPVPKFMQEGTFRPFLWYLAVGTEVSHINVPRCRGSRGLRVRHSSSPPVQRSAR